MPAPVTGHVFYDKNADGIQNGTDFGMAGLTVIIVETIYLSGFTGSAVTDANGFYSIATDATFGGTNYEIRVVINDEYLATASPNPAFRNIFPGDVINFGFITVCTRVISSWLTKVCFIQNKGVRVTFRHRKRLVTVLYPGTTLLDYGALVTAASKGRWIHWFYAKVRPYIVWPTSP
jgi:hypothetical protein